MQALLLHEFACVKACLCVCVCAPSGRRSLKQGQRSAYPLHWRAQAQGGEDMLLDEFEGLGLHCEPRTQLVVLCEVCMRPSTKECWTCGMKICDFCTLKRHWKAGAFLQHTRRRRACAC